MEPPVVLPPAPVEFHINYNTKTVPKHQTQRTPRFQGRGGVLGWAGQHQESRPAASATALHSWASHLAPRRALPLPFLSISSLNVAKQENFCSNNTEVSLPRVTLAGVSRTFKFFSLKPQHWQRAKYHHRAAGALNGDKTQQKHPNGVCNSRASPPPGPAPPRSPVAGLVSALVPRRRPRASLLCSSSEPHAAPRQGGLQEAERETPRLETFRGEMTAARGYFSPGGSDIFVHTY